MRIFNSNSGPQDVVRAAPVPTLNESALTLAFGDVVEWVNPAKVDPTRTQPRLLITEQIVSREGPSVEYAVNGSAWFTREELVLVARSTLETIKEASTHVDSDEDDEDYDDLENGVDCGPQELVGLDEMLKGDDKQDDGWS